MSRDLYTAVIKYRTPSGRTRESRVTLPLSRTETLERAESLVPDDGEVVNSVTYRADPSEVNR